MRSRRRKQQPPLKQAIRSFIAGALFLILAIVIPLTSVNCSYVDGVQFCTVDTYDGLDAHTFGIVLGVISVLCFGMGVYYLMRHKQALTAKNSGAAYSASQQYAPQQPGAYPPVQQPGAYPPIQQPGVYPPAPQQPGAYPPVQNGVFPGGYAGDASYQPPSNTFPRQ